MTAPRSKLGVLLSGRGSNFVAIADSIANGSLTGCDIALVLSNDADAPGLAAARSRGLTAIAMPSRGTPRDEHDARMIAALQAAGVDLVVLAGYMRVLTPAFIVAFRDRVVNIHPSLLPSFAGLHAQRQALEYGAAIAGCTVHFVDNQYDGGPIITQRAVPVLDADTPQSLAARVLEQEHRAYAEAAQWFAEGRLTIEGRRVRVSGNEPQNSA